MNTRYLDQVLRDRGIPALPLQQLQAFVDGLSGAEEIVMEERLRKLSLGTETREDLEGLLESIRATEVPAADPAAEFAHAPTPPPLAPRSPATGASSCASAVGQDDRLAPDVQVLRQHGFHVYAKSAALKIELGTLRTEAAAGMRYTVQLDAAKAVNRGYDWRAKVPFQFTLRELPRLAAALLGLGVQKLALSNHGPNADKHFELEDQGAHLYVKVRVAGGPTISLPVSPPDVFAWGELCLVALHLNRPSIGTDGHLALLRRVGRMETSS